MSELNPIARPLCFDSISAAHGLGSWAIDINQDRYATHFSNGLGVPYSEQARATSDDCDPARRSNDLATLKPVPQRQSKPFGGRALPAISSGDELHRRAKARL